jgi:hypothetical protein
MNRTQSSLSAPLSLLSALDLAAHYRRRLEPFCERVEVTGALRRRRFSWRTPEETRIELLAIPKIEVVPEAQTGWPEFRCDLLHAAVLEMIAAREFLGLGPGAAAPGRSCHRLLNETCELVVWVAAAHNFGSVWLWRTGSRAHTAWLCERARRRRACWVPQAGLCTGLHACGAEEADIYRGLGLQFVPPESREPGRCEAGQFDLPEEVRP